MDCPRCHLENPPSAESCDCGYSFVTRSMTPTPRKQAAPEPQQQERSSGLAKLFWVLAIIGSVVGGIQVLLAQFEDSSPKQSASIAFGIAYAAIPYCLARAVSVLGAPRKA